MKLGQLATDRKKETEGTWVDAGSGLKLLVARLNNTKHVEYLRKNGKSVGKDIARGDIKISEVEELSKKAVAETVLHGWQNLTEEDGKTEIPFSREKALELFNTHPEFFKIVSDEANNIENFRVETIEEVVKN